VSFDRIAPHYRWLEAVAFGNALQRARVAWLADLENPVRALIVGEGNGKFLCELLRTHPRIEVDCLDASARMLQLARERVHREGRGGERQVRFLHADLRTWSPKENIYDLIVTHFVLDCFTENEATAIVGKLARALTADASWLIADFSIPSQKLARLRTKVWLAAMYLFFRVVAAISARHLIDASPLLERHRFQCLCRRSWQFSMLKSELWRRSQY
jgi:ubiquinone/menaquinone biosynthesis C-methylase UbiE